MVKLFHGVHAAVGFGEKALDVEAILRAESRADAEGNQIAAGNLAPPFDGELIQTAGLFEARLLVQPGNDHHEFISAHAGDVIVAAAGFLQVIGKILQQVIAFKVAKEVVDLFEIVEVADHNGQRCTGAAAAGEFARQVDEKRTCVGQTGEVSVVAESSAC